MREKLAEAAALLTRRSEDAGGDAGDDGPGTP
jgi:hypothetical protein